MGIIRTSYINAMALKVLKDCRITAPPVDLRRIVEGKGYTYMEVDTFPAGVSALFVAKDGINYAVVNAQHHPHRRRFSLAHELGHILLNHNAEDLEVVSSIDTPPDTRHHFSNSDPREKEANIFAGALLIPRKMLKVEFDKGGDIQRLAGVFSVSQQAMSIAVLKGLNSLTK